jgi:hypothetical protein
MKLKDINTENREVTLTLTLSDVSTLIYALKTDIKYHTAMLEEVGENFKPAIQMLVDRSTTHLKSLQAIDLN